MAVKVKVDAETRSAEKSLKKVNKQLAEMTNQGTKQTRMFRSLGRVIGAAFAGAAVAAFVVKMKNATDQMQRMQNLMKSSGVKNVSDGMGQVYEISQQSRGELEGIGELFAKITRSSSSLGATQQDAADATRAVAQSLQLSGASAQEATSATLQLGQALASGRLQGDELRSILESAPGLARTIAESMGKTVGQMRELASQGKLTSKVVFDGILESSEKVNKEFQELEPTIGQSMTMLNNGFTLALSHVGNLAVEALGLNSIFAAGGDILADWGDGRRHEGLKDALEEIDDAIERISRRRPFEGLGGNGHNNADFATILKQIEEIGRQTEEIGSAAAYEESIKALEMLIEKEEKRLELGKGATGQEQLQALRAQLTLQKQQVQGIRDIETAEANVTKITGIQARIRERIDSALSAQDKGLNAREKIEHDTAKALEDIAETRERINASGQQTLLQSIQLTKLANDVAESEENSLAHLAAKNELYISSIEAQNVQTKANLENATIAEKVAGFAATEAQTNATILKQLQDKGVLNAAQTEEYREAVRLSGAQTDQLKSSLEEQVEHAERQATLDNLRLELQAGGLTIEEERAILRAEESVAMLELTESLIEQGVSEEAINEILRTRLRLQSQIAEEEDAKKRTEETKKYTAAIGETGRAIMQLAGDNKKANAMGKALAISAATINTYLAVSEALSAEKSGEPNVYVRYANAAVAMAQGMAAVNSIASARQYGGMVDAGGMYQVGEKGAPEMFSQGGKNYLIPGDSSGTVLNNKKAFGSSNQEGQQISNTITMQVTGSVDDATRRAMLEMSDELADIVTTKQTERGTIAA